MDDGTCNQELNYKNCGMYDAGDCCDPRSVNDLINAPRRHRYNNQCKFSKDPVTPANISAGMKEAFDTGDKVSADSMLAWEYVKNDNKKKLWTNVGPQLWYNGTLPEGGQSYYEISTTFKDDESMFRWSPATYQWSKLLSIANFAQFQKFNTKLAFESIRKHAKFLKFKHLPSLRRVHGDGFTYWKLAWLGKYDPTTVPWTQVTDVGALYGTLALGPEYFWEDVEKNDRKLNMK